MVTGGRGPGQAFVCELRYDVCCLLYCAVLHFVLVPPVLPVRRRGRESVSEEWRERTAIEEQDTVVRWMDGWIWSHLCSPDTLSGAIMLQSSSKQSLLRAWKRRAFSSHQLPDAPLLGIFLMVQCIQASRFPATESAVTKQQSNKAMLKFPSLCFTQSNEFHSAKMANLNVYSL